MATSLIGTPNKTRVRRTRAEIDRLCAAMAEELTVRYPQSVRHLVVRGLVDKTEAGYDTIQTQLVRMRCSAAIPYERITDGTRWARRVKTYGSPADAIAEVARYYRRNLWEQTPVYVECWCESDSIAGVIVAEQRPRSTPRPPKRPRQRPDHGGRR